MEFLSLRAIQGFRHGAADVRATLGYDVVQCCRRVYKFRYQHSIPFSGLEHYETSKHGRMDGWMDERLVEWMDEWMNVWMVG